MRHDETASVDVPEDDTRSKGLAVIHRLRQRIAMLKEQHEVLRQRALERLKGEKRKHNDAQAELKERIRTLEEQCDSLRGATVVKDEAPPSERPLEGEAEEIRSRLVTVEAERDQYLLTKQRLETELQALKQRARALHTQRNTVRDELTSLRATSRRLKESVSGSNAREVELLRGRLDSLAKQRDTYRNRLLELNQRLKTSAEVLQQRCTAMREQRDALRIELAAAKLTPERIGNLLESTPAIGFARALSRGDSFVDAALAYTRSQLDQRERVEARAFAHALCDRPETRRAGLICSAIQAHYDGFYPLARHLFRQLDTSAVRQMAPAEWVDTLFETADPEAITELEAVKRSSNELSANNLLTVIRVAVSHQKQSLARQLLVRLKVLLSELTEEQQKEIEWLSVYLEPVRSKRSRKGAESSPCIALMDYKTLDRSKTSSNLGDYVQTLAMLSNVVRFTSVKFKAADKRLETFVDGLRERLASNMRIDEPNATAYIDILDRDFSSGRSYAKPTWLIAFGWHMHANFGKFFDFPFPSSVRPIFISFHVNNPALLTPRAVEYLKRYQPIGCRDWTTVYLLREMGVQAFFSGCMTTTIGKLFAPKMAGSAEQPRRLALVDARTGRDEFPGYERALNVPHIRPEVRDSDLVTNLDGALRQLETYREFDAIATSRLHCYLPCRALGLETSFRPRNKSDIRFEGLVDLSAEEFDVMRQGIEAKLAAVLELILSGGDERSVYGRWREVCHDSLADAERYTKIYPALPPPSFDVSSAAKDLSVNKNAGRSLWPSMASRMEVALATDQNLAEDLPVVLQSVLDNTRQPVRFHIMTRGLTELYYDRIRSEFENDAEFVFYDFGAIDYGSNLRLLKHTTVSTIDRLLLPDLLENLEKVIYLDVDIVVLGDLAELWRTKLGDAPIAGKLSTSKGWKYGYNMVYRAASRLPYSEAWALRRMMHDRGPLMFNAFNAGVVLMNLARMREDDFAKRHIPLVEHYAMNDQDVLNVYARNERIELSTKWNCVPSQDITDRAKILHYAGPVKPWSDLHIVRKAEFLEYRSRYLSRRVNRKKNAASAGKPTS